MKNRRIAFWLAIAGVAFLAACGGGGDSDGGGAPVTPTTTPTFGPSMSFVREGSVVVQTVPDALTVSLGAPAVSSTFVPIVSSNSASLSVVGGGVTIPAGQTSAVVLLDALAQNPAVTLSATVGAHTLTVTVRVVGSAELPALASLTPNAASIAGGGSVSFHVALDMPAPAGGTTVTLQLLPAQAGTIPASVVVPRDALGADFTYVDAGVAGAVQVTATLGVVALSTDLTVKLPGQFVINEVDYDQIGTDTASYVELLNDTVSPIDLANFAVVLINGATNQEYARFSLATAGVLQPGGYLVIRQPPVVVPTGTATIEVADNLQNGAPDGIALIDAATQSVVDSFSYEGSITAAMINGFFAPVNLVRGNALSPVVADSNTVVGALCRIPNGRRSNDDASDWRFCNVLTPGAANAE